MTIQRFTNSILGLCIVSILFSFLSCGGEGRSIYWTIINAREEEDYSLDNKLTILSMTDDGTNYYISAGGSLWWQEMTLSDDEWEKAGMPHNTMLCSALEYYGSELYGAFIFDNGSAGLYSTTNLTDDDPVWTPVSDPLIDGKQIIRLMEVNSRLFISLLEDSLKSTDRASLDYSLYFYDGIIFNDIADGVTDCANPVQDITWNGTTYWAITGSRIFEINSAVNTATEVTSVDPNGDLGGIYYDSGSGKTYVSSQKGNMYIFNGSTWNYYHDDDDLKKVNGKIVAFTGIREINGNIVVGSHGGGFYEMRDGTLGSLERAGESDDMDTILSSDLYTSKVLSLYVTPPDMIFFCTGGNGLYHNTYDGSKWSKDWVHE
jgi:hypothetical protein